MIFKLRLIGVGALLLAQMSLPVFANNSSATVVSVGDGDTIRVKTSHKTVTPLTQIFGFPKIHPI